MLPMCLNPLIIREELLQEGVVMNMSHEGLNPLIIREELLHGAIHYKDFDLS